MKYAGKDISALSDDELRDAIHSVVGIDKNRLDKLDTKRKRHIKIFKKHPPVENPVFTNLAIALNNEFKSRNIEFSPNAKPKRAKRKSKIKEI